jgi:hypothetical protein
MQPGIPVIFIAANLLQIDIPIPTTYLLIQAFGYS